MTSQGTTTDARRLEATAAALGRRTLPWESSTKGQHVTQTEICNLSFFVVS